VFARLKGAAVERGAGSRPPRTLAGGVQSVRVEVV